MTRKHKLPLALLAVFAMTLALLVYFPGGAFNGFDMGMTASAAWDGTAADGFAGGDGSEGSPFEIATGEQLAYFEKQTTDGESYENKYLKLTADIDLGGREWTPIGSYTSFKGCFDGNGHSVSNFIINDAYSCYVGLFADNRGTIKNLGVENAKVTGDAFVGGICGFNYEDGTISNCYNTGTVSGSSNVGGICGNNDGAIQNCYNTGAVNGSNYAIGGVCGTSDGTITNCYNAGTVNGKNNVGSICGREYNATIADCYYDKDICTFGGINGSDADGSATGLTAAELCGGTLPTGFSPDVWNVGSIGELTATEGRFSKKLYTYPSIKNVGTATVRTALCYNFSVNDTPDWQEYTLISTPEELKALGEDSTKWDKNYILGADIDLGGEEITPIGNSTTKFTGKFSGDGHTVSNFKINMPNTLYVGLFGYSGGLIMDLGVENAEVEGKSYVGGACGYNRAGTVTNCYNTGKVNGAYYNIGGICGGNNGGTIQNCSSAASVKGKRFVGGVCGYNEGSGTVTSCYNTGAVSGNSEVGGICGKNSSGTVTNCYYNKDICTVGGINGSDADGSATGLTAVELCGELPNGFADYVWIKGSIDPVIDSKNPKIRTLTYTFPSLKGVGEAYVVSEKQYNFGINSNEDWLEYTVISTAEEFKAIGEDSSKWGKNYVLDADIDLGGAEITPIGEFKPNYIFTGKFSGNGHTVSNFKINKPDNDQIGLFGYSEGLIMKLGVENAEVTGSEDVGSICGYNAGTITDCHNAATVNGNSYIGGICGRNEGTITDCHNAATVNGYSDVGGISGRNVKINGSIGIIINCYNSGSVKGNDSFIGGVCGENYDGTIENSYNTGAVSGKNQVGGVCGVSTGIITNSYNTGTVNGTNGVGGVCGGTSRHVIDLPSITNCYNTGAVSGEEYIGGVCGSCNENIIKNCYNTGAVTGSGLIIGGICGYSSDRSTISSCYNTGAVSGNSWGFGGVCGERESSAVITNCYYNKDVCPVGGINEEDVEGSATGLTSDELCNGLPEGFESSVWVGGDHKFAYNSDNERMRSAEYSFPCLRSVGKAYTVRKKLYNFISYTDDSSDWQEYTLISTAEEFKALGENSSAWDKNYVLGADIDLGGAEITPIGNADTAFTGKFSGDAHIVSNFKINMKNSVRRVGLFGSNSGLIMDLGVENAEVKAGIEIGGVCGYNTGTIANCYNAGTVSGNSSVGGVCGMNEGTITNCYNTGAVSSIGTAGGVCGANFGGTVTNCYNEGTVNGDNGVGGVCGYNHYESGNGTVENCYNTGAVSGDSAVGGVCGDNDNGYIENCYNTGTVSGSDKVGGVCGNGYSSTIRNCYYNKDICTVGGINGSDTGDVRGLTTDELCGELPTGFDSSVWTKGGLVAVSDEDNARMRSAKHTFPSLKGVGKAYTVSEKQYNFGIDSENDSWQGYTLISTADEFKALTKDGADWKKNYVLGADIDLKGATIEPIGNEETNFTGRFSGDGHIVSNFKINKPKDNSIGLFGDSSKLIMNLGVENAEVIGKNIVGGICGTSGGTIINCYYAGTVSGTFVGGICGINGGNGTIANCYNTGTISGNGVGGICGDNQSNITNCYNAGKVSGNGVCGYYDLKGTATNCYYNKDICTGDKYATGLTTIQMTDNDVFKTMNLDIEVWGKMDNDRGNKIAYYPELIAVKGSKPSIKYETKLDISAADGDGSEETKLNVSALVKFDGMTEFKADETALTSGKGSFTVSLFDETLVPSTDICDNTTVTVTAPHVDQIDEPDLTLTYNAGTSCFFSDSSRKLLDGAVAVYDGTETKAFDDLTSALKAYKTSTKPLTINLREDAEVKTLALPTKAQSITFAGRGKLIFSGTSITFPTNTTINIDIVGTNAKPFAVKSAANKTLTLNKSIEKLGTLGGTATSTLNINADITAASISTFKEINIAEEKILTSNGNVSGIATLNGTLKLTNPKSIATVTNIGKAKLIFTDTNGAIAKATVKDIIDNLIVEIIDSSDEMIALSNSRTILRAGGNIDFTYKIDIANKSEADQILSAFLYGKEIKAEYSGAVSLKENDGEAKDYPNIDLAFKAITNKNSDYTITLYNDVTASKFTIPSKANSITFTGTGSLDLNMTSLTAPVDVTFDVEVNGTNAKPLAIKSATKKTLTFNKAVSNIGTISGTATSILNINADITAAGISSFKEVIVAEEKILTSNGNVSGVVLLNGTLKLTDPKSTAVITNIGNAKLMFADTNGTIAKATVKNIENALEIAVVDEEGAVLTLDSGRTVLWAGGNINFTEKITIENTTAASKTLNAFLYAKDIRAEYAGTLTLSDGTTSTNYPNFELALKEMTDKTKDYVVTVNENTSTAKFVLPALAKAQSVTIKSENEAKTITLTNITAVSAKTPLTLENIKLESTKPYTISTTSDLTLDRFASDSITAVRGGAKATLTLGETTPIDKVSGFGTTKVTSEFRTGTMFTTTDLELTETANLVVSNTKAPATAKTLNGAEGSVITLDTGFTPIKVTGTTADSISGTIKLKATEAIDENTVLFTTKYAGNNVFDVTEIQPQTELDYTVTSISGKAYMKPIVFEMNNTGYALWTDVMTVIENVKMSEAQYTVKLLDSTNINGALKLPKAGTYGKLTITSESKTLTFTGSITLTGELEIANTNLVSARNTTSSKYTISAGKYPFTAENTDLSLASITSTADVTLKNTRTSGTVRAGKLTLNGEDTILGTITANELGSTEEGTVLNILSNTRGVMSITKNGISENSEEITIKLVDESENAVTAENLSIIASSFTGNYNGELKLSTENGEFSIILSRNKLVLADSETAANGLLEFDPDEDETAETDPAEEPNENPEDETPVMTEITRQVIDSDGKYLNTELVEYTIMCNVTNDSLSIYSMYPKNIENTTILFSFKPSTGEVSII